MKRVFLLALSIPLLSIAILAQTPRPSVATTPSPSINQATPSASPNPVAAEKPWLALPFAVAILASLVMLSSVFVVFFLVWRQQDINGLSIGPRHIQFVSV